VFYGYAMNALDTKVRHSADELALTQAKGCRKTANEILRRYIKAEVWDELQEDRRDFILKIAAADVLEPELCDKLSGRNDSAKLLDHLHNQNVFITRLESGEYRFHGFFREFLKRESTASDYRVLADWYYKKKKYDRAAEYYHKSGSMETYALMAMAYEAYLNGKTEEQALYTDALLKISENANEFEIFCITVYDHRVSVSDILEKFKLSSSNLFHLIPSITQELPFIHRSFRDFSELALLDEKEILSLFQNVPQWLCPFMNAVFAGIHYEKGNYEYATYFNKLATEAVSPKTPPDLSLSIKIMQASIDETEPAVAKANPLSRSIRAYKARRRFKQGDTLAAEKWLAENNTNPLKRILLYDTYTYFTTVRALLLCDEPEQALLLLVKLRRQSELNKRPLDIIETDILRVIAYNMHKNFKKALEAMTSALISAQKYGFTTLFINEAREIYTTLNDLSFHITRSGETHGIDLDFLSFILSKASKKLSKNFIRTLYNKQPAVKLTSKQAAVAEMLNKGYSYQEIAQTIGVTHATAKSYLRELYNKLGAFNANEALDELYKLGILREGAY